MSVKEEFLEKCSFCGSADPLNEGLDDQILVVGPEVSICDGCIELCYDIVKEERRLNEVPEED